MALGSSAAPKSTSAWQPRDQYSEQLSSYCFFGDFARWPTYWCCYLTVFGYWSLQRYAYVTAWMLWSPFSSTGKKWSTSSSTDSAECALSVPGSACGGAGSLDWSIQNPSWWPSIDFNYDIAGHWSGECWPRLWPLLLGSHLERMSEWTSNSLHHQLQIVCECCHSCHYRSWRSYWAAHDHENRYYLRFPARGWANFDSMGAYYPGSAVTGSSIALRCDLRSFVEGMVIVW